MRILLLAALLLSCAGCASVIDGPNQYVDLVSYPPGATCTVNQAGVTVARVATPGSIVVARHPYDLDITCVRDGGYDPLYAVVPSRFVGDTFGNLLFFPPFAGVDAYTGAFFAYPSQLMLPMARHDPLSPPRLMGPPQRFTQSTPTLAPRSGTTITSVPLPPPSGPLQLAPPTAAPAVPVE